MFSWKKKAGLELIVDIESDLVSAAIVSFAASKPRILYSVTRSMRRKAHTDGKYLTRMMLRTLSEAAHAVATEGLAQVRAQKDPALAGAKIAAIHFVLSSPWMLSKLSCISKSFDKDTTITRKGVAALIEAEKAEASKLFAAGDALPVDMKLLEAKVNGYAVNQYEGKKARSFEATLSLSFASRKLVRDMKSAVNHSIRARVEDFHSGALLRYAGLRAILPAQGDYAWANVHGELTDIVIVRGDSCAASGSFPFGSETLLRKLAKVTGESEESAASALAILKAGSSEKAHASKISTAAAEIAAEWTKGLAGILGPYSDHLSRIYLSSRRQPGAFEDALRVAYPASTVSEMSASLLAAFVDFPKAADNDAPIGLYAVSLRQAHRV